MESLNKQNLSKQKEIQVGIFNLSNEYKIFPLLPNTDKYKETPTLRKKVIQLDNGQNRSIDVDNVSEDTIYKTGYLSDTIDIYSNIIRNYKILK